MKNKVILSCLLLANLITFFAQAMNSNPSLDVQFMDALEQHNYEEAIKLLGQGADAQTKRDIPDISWGGTYNCSALHLLLKNDKTLSLESKDVELIKILIKKVVDKGLDINIKVDDSRAHDACIATPLGIHMVHGGNVEIIKFLLDLGADVNIKVIENGLTLLMLFVGYVSFGIIDLKNPAVFDKEIKEKVILLLEYGADINALTTDNINILSGLALSYECHCQYLSPNYEALKYMIKLFLELGVDPNVRINFTDISEEKDPETKKCQGLNFIDIAERNPEIKEIWENYKKNCELKKNF